MSFGVSPSDLGLLLRGLINLTKTLRKGAVESYKRCTKTYETLSHAAKHVDAYAANIEAENRQSLERIRKNMGRLLNEYHHHIKTFKHSLGANRDRYSIASASAKLKWKANESVLDELREQLQLQMDAATFMAVLPLRPKVGIQVPLDYLWQSSIPGVHLSDHFIFEDARRDARRITFSDVPDWEHFHEFLLRVFPSSDPGHQLIATRAYLLHNASSAKYILPSGPAVKSIRDVIAAGERVEMNVIYSAKDVEFQLCPNVKCRSSWETSHSVVINCPRDGCGLRLQFMDSFEDQADPLTQIVIDDMREQGVLKQFVTEFIEEIESDGYLNPGMTKSELKSSIRRKLHATGPSHAGSLQVGLYFHLFGEW